MLQTPFGLLLRKKQKHFKCHCLQYTENSFKRHSKSDLSIIHKLLSPSKSYLLERIRLDSEVKSFEIFKGITKIISLKKCVATLQKY